MSREAFEQWYVTNAFDFEKNPLGSRECSLQWQAWQAATKTAEPKWIPMAENRDGANPDAPDGSYWVCVEHKKTKLRHHGIATYYWAYGWMGNILHGLDPNDWYVIARHPLPEAYVPEGVRCDS